MLIDTNIFLELFLEQDKKDSCRAFLNKTINGEFSVIVSDFTIYSVILNMVNNKSDVGKIHSFLKTDEF